jgi:transposase
MYAIGVDHHKANSYVTSLAEDGTVFSRHNLSASPEVLTAFFRDHPRPFVVGIEATYAWEYVADIVEGLDAKLCVAHPLLLKAFAKRHRKNDKIDSALIATLLHQGHLPTIAHPPLEARRQRDLYRQRMELVSRRTGAACRAKAFADRLGFQATMNLSALKGIAELAALPVGPGRQSVLDSHVSWLTFLHDEIKRLERTITTVADQDPDSKRLKTLPGIGPYLALLIASEVFDITRFPNARHFVSYAGVAPGSQSSAGKRFAGHLPAAANKYLRWAFTEIVHHYMAHSAWAKCKYDRLRQAKGWKTARMAIARHVATIVYGLLRQRRDYQPTPPHAQLRREQGGLERRRRQGSASTAERKRGRTLQGSAGIPSIARPRSD